MSIAARIAVIGGGISGLATAYYLKRGESAAQPGNRNQCDRSIQSPGRCSEKRKGEGVFARTRAGKFCLFQTADPGTDNRTGAWRSGHWFKRRKAASLRPAARKASATARGNGVRGSSAFQVLLV